MRQFGKCILEQVSNTRGLVCGLKFLCSHGSSLSAVFFGLRHAVKLVILFFPQISGKLKLLTYGQHLVHLSSHLSCIQLCISVHVLNYIMTR